MSLNSMLLRGTAAGKPSTATFAYQLYIETDGSQVVYQGDSALAWQEVTRGVRPALTGDVTASAGSSVTTLAAGSASNLNSGTLPAGRLPALTGDVTSSAGSAATTINYLALELWR